jgi:hypothetical protein
LRLRLSFFFPRKAFICWGFDLVVFTTSGFPFLASGSGSNFWVPNAFNIFLWRWRRCEREKEGRIPSGVFSLSVFSFPMNLGGAKNLTVKSILWRGSAYRFPSLSVRSHKKERKKNRRKRVNAFLSSEEAVG